MEEDQVNTAFDIITKNLEETIGDDEMKAILASGRPLKVYWGTAPTGKPHLGYFVPMFKILDLVNAGCEVTVLLADLHAYLDAMKSTWELLDARVQYYEAIIKKMLEIIGCDLDKVKFVRGTDYQLSREYSLDLYKYCASVNVGQSQRAGTEVVKQMESPLLSSTMYPLLQSLDEQYLDVDVQLGGVDQRKIFMFSRTQIHKLGFKTRAYLMNPLVPGLGNPVDGKPSKMSSSEPLSKIDFDDSNKQIKNKMKKAYSKDGEVENNGVLAMCKFIIFRYAEVNNEPFVLKRREEHGGDITFDTYEDLEAAFVEGSVASADIKQNLGAKLINIISPLRNAIKSDFKEIHDRAYPPPPKPAKKGGNTQQATFGSLDVRVGVITEIEEHPRADKLYVEKIDVGEAEPRIICSGLKAYYSLEELQGKKLLVICNLEPRPMLGVKSFGMVYCASNKEHSEVVLLEPPEDSQPGDRVFVEGFEDATPEEKIKSKRYGRIAKKLATNSDGLACWDNKPFQTKNGLIKNTIPDGNVA